jgi:hypothetical protein
MGTLIRVAERSFLAVAACAALGSYAFIYSQHLNYPPIRSDGYGYYLYLPAWFIYHDASLQRLADHCCNGTFPAFTAITRWHESGAWINPHPIGTAILIAPFFAVGHLLTLWSDRQPNGFTLYYQHAAGLAGVFYLVAGLAVLRAFLKRHFSDGVTLAALISITWGTNLFHYGTYDSVYSHVYSFFLCCSFLYATMTWYDRPTLRRSMLAGLVAGLIFLTRHANVLFLAYFPLYGVLDRSSLVGRLRLSAANVPRLTVLMLTAALVAAPQLLIYRAATGSFLVDPYGNLLKLAGIQAFHFGSPQICGVLFSVKKGLFFWSPILFLSVAGFFALRGTARSVLVPSLLFLPLNLYLVASWWDWQFGGSYGHRGFTDSLGVLAVSMAASYQWVSRRPRVAAAVTVFAVLAILLSIAQMVQYWLGILPISDSTWLEYRTNFLRFSR